MFSLRQQHQPARWQSLVLPVLVLLLLLPLSLRAEINDPTRPLFLKKKTVVVAKKKTKPVVHVIKHEAPATIYTLTSTLVSSARTVAVINDRIVAVGDHVDGATVLSIDAARVRLRKGANEITLTLVGKKVKKLLRGYSVTNKQRLP